MKKGINRFFYILIAIVFCSLSKGFSTSYEDLLKFSSDELLKRGDAYLERHNPDSALVYYVALSGRYASQASKREKENALQGLIKSGGIYYQEGNYNQALDLYFRAFRICETEEINAYFPELYNNMGSIYNRFKDYERGKDYYLRGLKCAEAIGDVETEWKLLNNLVGLCCFGFLEDSDIEDAKIYYDRAKNLKLENDTLQRYYIVLGLGYIFTRENKLDSAIAAYQSALDFAVENSLEPRYVSSPASEIAFLYEEKGDYESALKYLLFANEFNQENRQIELELNGLQNLATIYEKMGDHDKSADYWNQYLNLSDSIFNQREFNRIKNMQMVYEMDKINQEVDYLHAEKAESDLKLRMHIRILIIVLVSLAVLIVLAFILYAQKKKLENAYFDLFSKNQEILKSDKANRKMRLEYEQKLQEEKEKTQRLGQELEVLGHKLEEQTSQEIHPDDAKGSKLSEAQQESLMEDIVDIMENTFEYCDSEFSLNRLAALIGSNTKYVSQAINDTHQKNFRAYINEYRIKEASRRLMNDKEYGHYTIAAIAESVGYKSQTTFILAFKKVTGINPSTYQRIAQKVQKEGAAV